MRRIFLLLTLAVLILVPGISDAQKKRPAQSKTTKKTTPARSKTSAKKKSTALRKKPGTARKTASRSKSSRSRKAPAAAPVYQAPAYFEPIYNPPLDERPIPPVLSRADEMPEFNGDLQQYIRSSLQYPDTSLLDRKGDTVKVRFIVTILGDIRNVQVVKSLDPALDTQALKLVKEMPRWTPAKHKGMYVNVYYTLPISFRQQ
jgi:TonB family protein